MKQKRFTEEQKAFALWQADSGVTIPEILRKMGISEATFYRWKKKYGGMGLLRLVGSGIWSTRPCRCRKSRSA